MEEYRHTVPSRRQLRRKQRAAVKSVHDARQKAPVKVEEVQATFDIAGLVDVGTFPRLRGIK